MITREDLFLRFCSLFGEVTQAIPTELLANLIHLDYSRDITFIAMTGTGLGKVLMTKIIGYCRAQRVSLVFGLVLRKNARMLGLCTRLGFADALDDHDDVVKVVLPL